MKPLMLILWSFSFTNILSAQSLDSSYHRDWATYFGGQGSTAVASDFGKRSQKLIVGFNVSIPVFWSSAFGGYNNYITIFDSLFNTNFNYFGLISTFNSDGSLSASRKIPMDIWKMKEGPAGNIVLFGSSEYSWPILPNIWRPNLLEDSLGVIVSLRPDLSVNWFTNFSIYNSWGNVSGFCLDEAGNIYTSFITDTLQPGTENSFEPVSQGHTTYICKISPSGDLLWGTFYGNTVIQAMDIQSGQLFVTGKIVDTSAIHTEYFISGDPWISTKADQFLSVFKTSNGQRPQSTYLPAHSSGPVNNLAVNNSGIALVFYNSSWPDSLLSNNAYQTQQDQIVLLKFDRQTLRPQWCTYIGGEGEDNISYYFDYFKATEDAFYLGGFTTSDSTGLIRTPNTYKHSNANPDSSDVFVMKFNNEGHLLWGTFYGGTNTELLSTIAVENDSSFYIGGQTFSISGIATPGSFEDTMSFLPGQLAQMQPYNIYHNTGNAFIAKFIDTTGRIIPIDTTHNNPDTTHNNPDTTHNNPDTTITPQNLPIRIYPIPNNGNFTVEGNVLGERKFAMAIFDAGGRRVIQRRLLQVPKQNFMYQKLLAAGSYVILLESEDGTISKAFRMVVSIE